MERIFAWLTKRGGRLRNIGIAVVVAALGVFLYALRFDATEASAWFQGEAVLLALIALVAAALAAVFTYPAYRDWWREQQRRPEVRLHIEVGNPTLDNPSEVTSGDHHEIKATQATFEVRAAVFNEGKETLYDGVLNICVPDDCGIEPMDDPRITHYRMPGTALNGELRPGQVVPVRATIAQGNFAPGIRMFHARVTAPISTTVPVLFVLVGRDVSAMGSRITVRVTP